MEAQLSTSKLLLQCPVLTPTGRPGDLCVSIQCEDLVRACVYSPKAQSECTADPAWCPDVDVMPCRSRLSGAISLSPCLGTSGCWPCAWSRYKRLFADRCFVRGCDGLWRCRGGSCGGCCTACTAAPGVVPCLSLPRLAGPPRMQRLLVVHWLMGSVFVICRPFGVRDRWHIWPRRDARLTIYMRKVLGYPCGLGRPIRYVELMQIIIVECQRLFQNASTRACCAYACCAGTCARMNTPSPVD